MNINPDEHTVHDFFFCLTEFKERELSLWQCRVRVKASVIRTTFLQDSYSHRSTCLKSKIFAAGLILICIY